MLRKHVARLNARLAKVEEHFISSHTLLSNVQNSGRWYPLEGMLSHSWQIWCAFCRAVFVESCMGTQTIGGLTTIPDIDWSSTQRVIYVATRHAKGDTPKAGNTLASIRLEFTWGDVSALTRVVGAMKPGNHASLLSGFGLSVNGAKHMQEVRNACAHLNSENLVLVRKLSIYYSGTRLRHPTDLMLWNDTISGDPAFLSWLDDIRAMATQATL